MKNIVFFVVFYIHHMSLINEINLIYERHSNNVTENIHSGILVNPFLLLFFFEHLFQLYSSVVVLKKDEPRVLYIGMKGNIFMSGIANQG